MTRPFTWVLLATLLLPGGAGASIAGLWGDCEAACTPGNTHCLGEALTFEFHGDHRWTIFLDVEPGAEGAPPVLSVEIARHRIMQQGAETVVEWRSPGDVSRSIIRSRTSDRIAWRDPECTEDCDFAMCRLDDDAQPATGVLRYMAALWADAPWRIPASVQAGPASEAMFPGAPFALVFPAPRGTPDFALVAGAPMPAQGQTVLALRPGLSLVLWEGSAVDAEEIRRFFGED